VCHHCCSHNFRSPRQGAPLASEGEVVRGVGLIGDAFGRGVAKLVGEEISREQGTDNAFHTTPPVPTSDFRMPRHARISPICMSSPKPEETGKSILIMNVHRSGSAVRAGPLALTPSRPTPCSSLRLTVTALLSPISHNACASHLRRPNC
jgi:hypothetical protein